MSPSKWALCVVKGIWPEEWTAELWLSSCFSPLSKSRLDSSEGGLEPMPKPRSNQRCIFSLHLVRYQWFPSRFTDPRLLQSNARRCCWIIIQARLCGWIVFPQVCTVAKAQLGVFLKIYTQNLNITSNYTSVCSKWALGLDQRRSIHVHWENPKAMRILTWCITSQPHRF